MNLSRIAMRNCLVVVLTLAGAALLSNSADAQGFGFRQPAVGGVMVDASGVVRSAPHVATTRARPIHAPRTLRRAPRRSSSHLRA